MRSTAHEVADDAVKPAPRRSQAQMLEVPEGTEIPHANRFSLITGALVAFAAICVVGGLIVAGESSKDGVQTIDLTWSQWQPTSKGPDQGAREIADHVAREYRLKSGEQLAAVTGGPMEIGGLPINLALRASQADGGDISLLPGNGVLYRMCGLGKDCYVDRGTPSEARHLLLRRQALELALYSFRYLKKDDVEDVVVFMPPPAPPKGKQKITTTTQTQTKSGGTTTQTKVTEPVTDRSAVSAETAPTTAIYFRREQLAEQLRQPLDKTLPGAVPFPGTVRTSANIDFVDMLTGQLSFQASVTPANQDSSVFLVLDPQNTKQVITGAKKGAKPGTPSRPTGSADPPIAAGSLSTPLSPTGPGAASRPRAGK